MPKLPESYIEHMKEILQDELDSYLQSFEEERSFGLSVNTLKIKSEDFLLQNPFHLKKIPWTQSGYYYEEQEKPAKHPYYHAGLYYLQEPSAMLPAEVLPIEEGDIVLDACAAPGGKTIKLAEKLNGTGILFSNDISISRCQVLLKAIEMHGIKNAIVMAEDISRINRFDGYFDKILLDVPCSGEGMFRKQPELIRSWIEKRSEYYVPIQKRIIENALKMLKEGGMMVYSTCTFSKEEDEEIIEYALSLCPQLKVLPIKQQDGFVNGLSDNTHNCIRLYPHRIKGEGHFVALLQKGEKTESRKKIQESEYVTNFSDAFSCILHNGILVRREEKLFYEPEKVLNLKGLRILRSGLYLGEFRHDKFEPSQALAMTLKKEECHNTIDFNLNDPRVLKYLKGETLDVRDQNSNGLTLLCVDHFPLGFGIISKGILKNKYPPNYRYR